MTYKESVDWLYGRLPMFESLGAGAYKPGLATTLELSRRFGNPHTAWPSIHIAGTNGKGSTASTLAAIFTCAGYKTALYTSPHLVDFRERMRINGIVPPEEFVTDFIKEYIHERSRGISPTFFELTTVMAFKWFEMNGVDMAIVETGLGGRLDSTNIITPELAVVTNVSLDHMAQLGGTRALIAAEKAGIFKRCPALVGEKDADTEDVYRRAASRAGATLYFTSDMRPVGAKETPAGWDYEYEYFGAVEHAHGSLCGPFQPRNAATAIAALKILHGRYDILPEHIAQGMANVGALTGLSGRWQEMEYRGHRLILDCGHNEGAWAVNGPRLAAMAAQEPLTMVLGFVADKDLAAIRPYLPDNARYIYTAPLSPRASSPESTRAILGHPGERRRDISDALELAAAADGTIFVGGSCYLAGDVLAVIQN